MIQEIIQDIMKLLKRISFVKRKPKNKKPQIRMV